MRRKRASAEKLKAGSPKPSAIVQSGSSVAPATKSSVPIAAFASSSSLMKQYKRKTSAGRIKVLESSEEVFSQSPYLLASFLSLLFSSLPSFLVLTICFHGCNNLVLVKGHNQKGV